jgi:hypothetical protein
MIKNTISVLIGLFSIFFLFFVVKIYFSENLKHEIKKNRIAAKQTIQNNIDNLPVLSNDTNDVIEFNSGFENKNIKTKRNFWKLFKIND